MTREEMIALANQAGMSNLSLIDIGYLEAFANLIFEAASEACKTEWNGDSDSYERSFARNECVDDIRSMKV